MHLKTRADSCLSNSERDGMNESDSSLHPRRNLGNRYRSNALKFIRLAESDPERSKEHMNWAEQNARQALLHDYTDTRNWICLVELKVKTNDTNGLHAVIKDLFSVLGRDPEQLIQLNDVDFLAHGKELVHAALLKDPLNPEDWWNDIVSSEPESLVLEFVERCKRLDFRDQRANIVFARRLEQLQANGFENEFLEIAHHLLAHRPQNHELWMQIGRSHERRNEYDQAWLCYDHVQQLRPHLFVRDEFLQRLTTELDGKKQQPWSAPTVEDRHAFLEKMERLTSRLRTVDHDSTEPELDDEHTDSMDKQKLNELISSNNMEEAFFYARRLVAQGEEWANEYLREIQENLS
jgi:tetratricopeptide (TPR) repeat protein